MNEYQKNLYTTLMALVQSNEAFFHQDFVVDDFTYRIFNYRLSSYSDFLLPGAIECRGVMFHIDSEENAIRLAALPMSKFFNLHENPMTMDVDLTDVESISNKSDGSLISTYLHKGELRLKSKGSTASTQAEDAMKWLDLPEQADLKRNLLTYVDSGYTVNMEWVGPSNRIVLGYLTHKLIILNIRDNLNGSYFAPSIFSECIKEHMDPPVDLKGMSLPDFVNQIPDMQEDIEGFVVKLNSGLWFKCKTKKYLALHHCKDSVNNPRRLFEVIVNEGIDDIRSMFYTDALLMKQIDDMQTIVDNIFNTMVTIVEVFYDKNKELDRKDFAIKAQAEVPKLYFGLVMQLYLGKPTNYKEFTIKNYKHFGIKDESVEE
jgi:T4 RnlA family RNA ligase